MVSTFVAHTPKISGHSTLSGVQHIQLSLRFTRILPHHQILCYFFLLSFPFPLFFCPYVVSAAWLFYVLMVSRFLCRPPNLELLLTVTTRHTLPTDSLNVAYSSPYRKRRTKQSRRRRRRHLPCLRWRMHLLFQSPCALFFALETRAQNTPHSTPSAPCNQVSASIPWKTHRTDDIRHRTRRRNRCLGSCPKT